MLDSSRRLLGFLAVVGVIGSAAWPMAAPAPARKAAARPASAVRAAVAPPQRELLDKYCVTCHNDRTKAGGLVLSGVSLEQAGANAETLEKVVRKLRTAQMPPPGVPRPDKAAVDEFATSLEAVLDQA